MVHKCSECGKEFSTNRLKELHYARHHTEWKEKCDICGKVFAHVQILQRHKKESHQPKNIKCPDKGCKIMFGTVTAMNHHHRKFHVEKQPLKLKEYPCEVEGCDKSFTKHHVRKQHSFEHTGVLPFKCTKCDSHFRTQAHCQRHEKTHMGYNCKECQEVCTTWSALRAHVKHSHSKQYKCTECDKIFSTKPNLNEHAKTHLDQREVYKCLKCSCTYTRKGALKKHYEVVHGDVRKHQCSVCDKKFAHKHTLDHHAVVHQPGYVKVVKPRKMKPRKKKPTENTKKLSSLSEKDSIIMKLTGLGPIS